MEELIRIDEAAGKLRLSVCTLRRLVALGKLPTHRLGKIYFFTNDDLTAYLSSCAIHARQVSNAS